MICHQSSRFLTARCLLGFAAALTSAHAAEDLLIDDFTDPASAAATVRYWGGASQIYEHDATQDADGNPASGALKVTVGFDLAAYGGNNQFASRRPVPGTPIDGSKYAKLEFDIKYAATSAVQGGAHYGNLEVGIGHADWSQFYFGTVQTPVGTNGWRRVSLTVNQNDPKLNQLQDFHLKTWSGGSGDGMTGTTTFWIDNVKLIAIPSTEPPPPPPAVTLEPAKPGLNLIASGNGDYSRQSVRTAAPEVSWVGAAGPVSYSFTIAEYPSLPNFGTFIYLVPGSGLGTGVTDPDWSQPRCLLAVINNAANGSGSMRIAYKNELANSNGLAGHSYYDNETPADLYDGVTGPGAAGTGKGGTLAFVNSSTVLGKWTLTFSGNTNISITPPAGNVVNVALPNEATAQLFAGSLYAYFGVVPGSVANRGQRVILSNISVAGVANPINEDFSTYPFDTTILEKCAADPPGVAQVTGPDTPFWLTWSLPAVGYVPRQSPSLGEDFQSPWTPITTDDVITAQGRRWKLLQSTQLLDPARNFFQLAKP